MKVKTIYLLNDDFLIIGKEIRTTFLGIVVKREKIMLPKAMTYYPAESSSHAPSLSSGNRTQIYEAEQYEGDKVLPLSPSKSIDRMLDMFFRTPLRRERPLIRPFSVGEKPVQSQVAQESLNTPH